jgi:DNA-directed RNA polymerase specialized sigma24 family protein
MDELALTEGARPAIRSAQEAEELVVETIHRHADAVLKLARLHSLCADDAHDAYQRGLELFLRHASRLDADQAHNWLLTVVKREAWAVRRQRQRFVGSQEFDFDLLEARTTASPEDDAIAFEDVAESAEALRRLKPQEIRALWLRASGRSYADAAGNERRVARAGSLLVDTHAPAAPQGLVGADGSVHATNDFQVSWTLPSDSGSPVARSRYSVCRQGTSDCTTGSRSDDLTHVQVSVPSSGTFELRVWLEDAAGHADSTHYASGSLSYFPSNTDAGTNTQWPSTDAPASQEQAMPPPSTAPSPITVLPPIGSLPPRPRVDPHLRIVRTARSASRIIVSGRISNQASGSVTLAYSRSVGGRLRRVVRTAAVRDGRFRATVVLTSALARATTGRLTVRYAGDDDTRPATARRTVALHH